MAHARTPSDLAGGHPSHPGAEHHGPSVRTYLKIGLILFVITVVEIGASFLTTMGLPGWVQVVTLLALATVKGSLVLMYFMHLRFDSAWFRFLFISGFVLAVFGVITFLILFSYHAGLVA